MREISGERVVFLPGYSQQSYPGELNTGAGINDGITTRIDGVKFIARSINLSLLLSRLRLYNLSVKREI